MRNSKATTISLINAIDEAVKNNTDATVITCFENTMQSRMLEKQARQIRTDAIRLYSENPTGHKFNEQINYALQFEEKASDLITEADELDEEVTDFFTHLFEYLDAKEQLTIPEYNQTKAPTHTSAFFKMPTSTNSDKSASLQKHAADLRTELADIEHFNTEPALMEFTSFLGNQLQSEINNPLGENSQSIEKWLAERTQDNLSDTTTPAVKPAPAAFSL